ncbi:type II toxin-antitoxin system VapC family toxin [Waterburya agarophytonicola K14]|uniref:Type II toxin-antitoxin system VapC family toxin n=1 Tax=Waterburya agarophytonicola KI4 TaxID=2874699 RepID=A0A964BU38_9CYAN|nr:type II toxin-antitoxin system VapC family toxin [Waterburya agarophytonicola]MCC0179505.1 type II toxin-antitoxin system VapC family toxin [Waterburya agarophytonicola KI4]
MSNSKKGILLDTHVWIWLFNGSTELSQKAIDSINQAGSKGKVFISAISVWELSMLVAKNRVSLSQPIHQWVQDSLSQPGVNLSVISPAIAIESSFLPGDFYGDPADRIIVATARVNDFILSTHDKKIIGYGEENYVICFKV